MKKILLSLAFAFATFTAVQAQAPRIGVRAGANLAGFEGDDNTGFERKWGFHAGLTTNFALLEDFLSLQPEVLFTQKGAESEDELYKLKTSYIEVPVLARINAGPLYFEGGPQVAFQIGEKTEYSNNAGTGKFTNDNVDDLKKTLLGYAAGIGLASTPLGVSLGVRYNSDFSNVYDIDNLSLRNSVFMFTVGFGLPTR